MLGALLHKFTHAQMHMPKKRENKATFTKSRLMKGAWSDNATKIDALTLRPFLITSDCSAVAESHDTTTPDNSAPPLVLRRPRTSMRPESARCKSDVAKASFYCIKQSLSQSFPEAHTETEST